MHHLGVFLMVSGLPKLSIIVSIVLWQLYFFSYLRIPSSNVLSGYYVFHMDKLCEL